MENKIISYINGLIEYEKNLSEKIIVGKSWKAIYQKCDQEYCQSNLRILKKIKRYINKSIKDK